MKNSVTVIFFLIYCLLVSGCDKVYHSKYTILFREKHVVCSNLNDPNEVLAFIASVVKQNEFNGLKATNRDIASYDIFSEVQREDMCVHHIAHGSFSLKQHENKLIMTFFSWNPGAFEGGPIINTKTYEKHMIEKLEQEKCIEVQKISN